MSPVGGSRHYVGGGLGPETTWACPSCGEDNQGPLAAGCVHCGAGKPGRHIGTQPPPPPTLDTETPEDQEPAPPPLNPAQQWTVEHPEASLEEAFTAGFVEGVRQARQAERPAAPPELDPAYVVNRTLVAALALFRDQVLLANPEEVTTGEWLSAQQVTALMRQISGEVVHG